MLNHYIKCPARWSNFYLFRSSIRWHSLKNSQLNRASNDWHKNGMTFFFPSHKSKQNQQAMIIFLIFPSTSKALDTINSPEAERHNLQRKSFLLFCHSTILNTWLPLHSPKQRLWNCCAPSKKKDWPRTSPWRRGQLWTISCQYSQQLGGGGSWPSKEELSRASTVSTTLFNYQIHFLDSKKERETFSFSLTAFPGRGASHFWAYIPFITWLQTAVRGMAEYGLYYGWLYAQP